MLPDVTGEGSDFVVQTQSCQIKIGLLSAYREGGVNFSGRIL